MPNKGPAVGRAYANSPPQDCDSRVRASAAGRDAVRWATEIVTRAADEIER